MAREEAESGPVDDESPKSNGSRRRVGAIESPDGHVVSKHRTFIGDSMDKFLAAKGLVRRAVPNDNSFYRCLAEEICLHQSCYRKLKEIVEIDVHVQYLLKQAKKLECVKDRARDLIVAASRLYNICFKIFRREKEAELVFHDSVTDGKEIMLYQSAPNTFERIYKKDTHLASAISQAILYRCLYEKVFQFPSEVLNEAIRRIRVDIDYFDAENGPSEVENTKQKVNLNAYRPPVPYGSVKALDPAIHRNTPLDNFMKEFRDRPVRSAEDMNRRYEARYCAGAYCLFRDGRDFVQVRVTSVVPENRRIVRLPDGTERSVAVSDLRSCPAPVLPEMDPNSVANNIIDPESEMKTFPARNNDHQMMEHVLQYPYQCTPPYSASVQEGAPLHGMTSNARPYSYSVSNVPVMCSSPATTCNERTTWWRPPVVQPQSPARAMNGVLVHPGLSPVRNPMHSPAHSYQSSVFASPVRSAGIFVPNSPFLNGDELQNIDLNANFSEDPNGNDLPQDQCTLRYFYNLGLKVFRERNVADSPYEREGFPSPPAGNEIPIPVFPQECPSMVAYTIPQDVAQIDFSMPPPPIHRPAAFYPSVPYGNVFLSPRFL